MFHHFLQFSENECKTHGTLESPEWSRTLPRASAGQFDAAKYLELYPDVAKDKYFGSHPLEHYQQYGKSEGRQNPLLTQDYAGTPATIADPRYSAYTVANRPSSSENQFYGNIYRGQAPDFSTPGYTLTGGSLGKWNNVAGEQARAAQPASMNQQVTQSFLQNLGRAPEAAGLNYYLNSGRTGTQIDKEIQQSAEATRMAPGAVNDYYNRYLGRDAKQSGLDYWSDQTGQIGAQGVAQAIKNSPEAQVRNAFQESLGRAPQQEGLDYWTNQINSGAMTQQQALAAIQNSPEAQVRNAFKDYLGRDPKQAGIDYWTQQMSQGMTGNEMRNLVRSSEEGANRNAWRNEAPQYALNPTQQVKKRSGGILDLRRA